MIPSPGIFTTTLKSRACQLAGGGGQSLAWLWESYRTSPTPFRRDSTRSWLRRQLSFGFLAPMQACRRSYPGRRLYRPVPHAERKAAHQYRGVENVEFLQGEIEHIPLPDNSVDVIISNCVINLAADKDRVLREAFRVLKPSGRFAVSDVIVRGSVPDEIRKSMLLWVGCIAGALQDSEYVSKLTSAGFSSIEIEPNTCLQHRRCQSISERRRCRCRRHCFTSGRQICKRIHSGREAWVMLRPDMLCSRPPTARHMRPIDEITGSS